MPRRRPYARKRSPEERAASAADLEGKRARSRWERNIFRWLRMLKNRGEIHEFQYEPKEFWFWSIKRGTRFYKPDYAVWDDEGAVPYFYEVKGVMDSVSRIKLERMAKYYPDVVVLIIDERRYNEIEREFGPQIEKWEWKP